MITPPSVSEADVRLAATGDRSAYERLVRRCAGLVTAVALSVVRDVERSEDIAQEVFIAAWKDLSKLRNPRTFLPWLRNMTRHLSLRTLRDRHVPTDGAVLADCVDARASVAEQLESSEQARVLEEALMALESDDREVLLVYYLLVMLGGISFSLKKLQARARDAEEREGLRRYALISGTVASIAVLGMCFGTVFEWPYPVFMLLWGGYVATWDVLVLVYLPRVTAPRLALERAEDPTAEARQRRDRLKVIAMVSYATLCTLVNFGLMGYAMWRR